MPDTFNPYSQWLGLPALAERPNHYLLLGLSPGESDPKKIAVAAEQAATKIRSFRPGSQAADWARLLDEIQAAKQTLLDSARKAEYDRKFSIAANAPAKSRSNPQPNPLAELFPPGFRPAAAAAAPTTSRPVQPGASAPAHSPPSLPREQPPAEDPASTLPPAAQITPLAGFASAYPSAMPPAGYPAALPSAAGVQPVYPSPMAPYGTAMPIDPMAPVLLAGAGAPYPSTLPTAYGASAPIPGMPTPVLMAQPIAPQATYPLAAAIPMAAPLPDAAPLPAAAAAETSLVAEAPGLRKASAAAVMMAARKERQTRNAAVLAGGVAGLVIVAGLAAYAVINGNFTRFTDLDEREVVQADTKGVADNSDSKSGSDARVTPTESGPAVPKTKDDTEAGPTVKPMPQPREVVQRPPTPEPMPEPMPAPPMPEPMPSPKPQPPMPAARPTKEQLAQLEAALKKARLALSEQSFDDAEAEAVKAKQVAILPEHQALAERLRLAIDHMKLFRPALSEAASNLEAAETIKVGSSTIVAIVETFPDKIIVRVNGMNKTFSFATIPPGLAVAILDLKRIGGEPDSRILKAMYVATAKDADAEDMAKARGWLQEVEGRDPNAAALLMFLDDSYEGIASASEAGEKKAAASAAAGETN